MHHAKKLRALSLIVLLSTLGSGVAAAQAVHRTETNSMIELPFTAAAAYHDPFNEVALDVIFTDPQGTELRVPGFWAGGAAWKARYASPLAGTHRFRSESTSADDKGLHGVAGTIEIKPYTGTNPLFVHGPLRVAPSKRHLEHHDGTPFFWLADTWWMGLCHRLQWPEDVKKLAADRKAKGFNAIQIVAGLYPDMHPFDPRGANEAGFPWTKEYGAIRPEYFNAADERLLYLVDEGFTPCIVGAWGYFMQWMGPEKAKQHWRYLIARYAALPVVWCAAGEANLPWYLNKGFPYDDRQQVADWTQVLRYIRATDPFRRPLTIHPTGLGWSSARRCTDDQRLIDFDMLQTPHGQADVVPVTLSTMRQSYAAAPTMPVINGEGAYEMLSDSLPTKWTRRMFWICMMNGAAGHTYGANGIWQVNRRDKPHGPSPHHAPGSDGYGRIPWDEAMNLPGSSQVAAGKKLFEQYRWHEFTPHPEWASFAAEPLPGPSQDQAQWIWFPEGNPAEDAPIGKRYLRKQFNLPPGREIAAAVLTLTADDAFSVRLNGAALGSSADWRYPARYDATAAIRAGVNVLAIEVENRKSDVVANPAGLIASLDIRLADGQSRRIVSDASWRSASAEAAGWEQAAFDDAAWPPVVAMGPSGIAPWGNLTTAVKEPPHAAGIPDVVRIIYAPHTAPVEFRHLGTDRAFVASYFDPITGETTPIGEVRSDEKGLWVCPPPKNVAEDDWVVIVEYARPAGQQQ
jgi:hypothetical protein